MRPEFELLKQYGEELYQNHRDNGVMLVDRLIQMRDHIELCDNLAETQKEIYTLFLVFDYWEKCLKFWSKYKAKTETGVVAPLKLKTKKYPGHGRNQPHETKIPAPVRTEPPPKETWAEIVSNPFDEGFLRKLFKGDSSIINPDKKKNGEN